MSVDTLIRAALDAGIELRFVDGRLKAAGAPDVLRRWAPRLREQRAPLIAALQAPAPSDLTIDWRPLARAYHQHHFGCPICCAAGKGYGLRCGTGAALWHAYSHAAES